MQHSSHPNMIGFQTCMTFSNSRAEQQCGPCIYVLFCTDYLIIWGWPPRFKPVGRGNYFQECHIFHKDESCTFNQAVLMMGYSFGDWTKSSDVVMSCEVWLLQKVVRTSFHTLTLVIVSCMNDIYIFQANGNWNKTLQWICSPSHPLDLISFHLSVGLF